MMNSAHDVLLVMDPVPGLNPRKDTSLALVREAQRRGLSCFAAEVSDLEIHSGEARARVRSLQVNLEATPFYELGEAYTRPLGEFGSILMRKDPPVDPAFVWATQVMELALGEGTRVINHPQALRNINEKLAISRFSHLCAPTLTAAHASTFKAFIEQHQEVVLKPLDGMGGKSIFRLHSADPNINVVLETLTQNGTQLAMAQGFLPAIAQGDKRILMIGGEAWPRLLARIPAAGESRGNLAAGGRGEVRDLGPAEAAIAAEVGPWLREQGVWFAGLDVIGDKLTEINVTSPTCVREIENADGSNIASALWDAFEQPLRRC